MLQGIKLLKLYGWEDLFCKAIEVVRRNELWNMLKINGNMVATGTCSLWQYFCEKKCFKVYRI